MANSKISQLPLSTPLQDSDLLAVVQTVSGSTLSTNQITVGDLKSGLNLSVGNVAGAQSGTEIVGGKVYLGGTPLLRNTSINQSGFYLRFDNGAFLATGTSGSNPISGAGRRMMWIPDLGAFRAGEITNTEWDTANLGKFSAAFGWDTKANGVASLAVGAGSLASNDQAVAFGYFTKATGNNSFAIGDNTESNSYNSVAMGIHSKANGYSSFAFGDNALATNYNSFAFGKDVQSTGQMAFAFGIGSQAQNTGSFALGLNCLSTHVGAFALGSSSEAHAPISLAVGGGSKTYGDCSFAVGNEAIAQGNVSISMGEGTLSVGNCSIAVGWQAQSLKAQSAAFGSRTIANGDNAFVVGDQSKANGTNSFAGGYSSVADGISSFAFGSSAWAKGFGAVAMGNTSVAEGQQSVALGYNNYAKGNGSFAAGYSSQATNEESIALGYSALAYGRQSVALGCFAEAGTTDGLNGMAAVAIGDNANAFFDYSLALGSFIKANAEGAFVIGKGISGNPLMNLAENSLVVGFGSPLATLYVGESPNELSSGNVGVGTTNPLAKLHVGGDLMLGAGTSVNKISTDGTLAGNSDLSLATEKAVKTYVDGLASSVRRNKGGIDCSTNPNYPAGLNGDTYQVTVAGKIGGVSGITVDVNDEIVCSADNAGGDQATVGSSWYIVEGNKDQSTETTKGIAKLATQANTNAGVNDTDIVTPLKLAGWLTTKSTTDLAEGSNLYYTAARFNTAFAAKSTSDLAEGTNLYYTSARFDSRFTTKNTDNLSEGTSNVYYTSSRFTTDFLTKSTTNLAEGTNLYYTDGRFDTRFGSKTTDNLAEGATNTYFSGTRVQQTLLTGLNAGLTGNIAATDDVVHALGKTAHHIGDTSNPHSVTKAQVGLGNVDNLQQLPLSYLDTDISLTANSDTKVASQKAVKAYMDGLSTNVRRNKGGIDCSTNPNYPTAVNGDTYQVTVAGKIGGASGIAVDVNDEIVCKANNGGGDQATVGSSWYIVEGNRDQATETTKGIAKIATQTLTNGGTNDTDYVTPLKLATWLTGKTTSNLGEGSNLYFTPARVLTSALTGLDTSLTGNVAASDTVLQAFGKSGHHIGDTSNPHNVTKAQVGLTNVDNLQQLPLTYLDTDGTLAGNSDTKVASQKATKTYVDAKLVNAKYKIPYQFSLAGQANATTGLMSKASSTTANPSGVPTTDPSNAGIINGGVDPYVVMSNATVKSIHLSLAQAAVSTGTADPGVTIRMDLYKLSYNSRTLLASFDVPLDNTKVSTANNLGNNNFQTAVLSGLSTALTAGDMIGLQFTNRTGSNTAINAAGRIYAVLETIES